MKEVIEKEVTVSKVTNSHLYTYTIIIKQEFIKNVYKMLYANSIFGLLHFNALRLQDTSVLIDISTNEHDEEEDLIDEAHNSRLDSISLH